MTTAPQRALKRAIAIVGTAAEFSRRIGITEQAISQWKITPVKRVFAVERISGVPRHELRPDIYPPPIGGPAGQPPASERVA